MLTITTENAESILDSDQFDGVASILESIVPDLASLRLTPYNALDIGHLRQVDIEVYYCWKRTPKGMNILHIRIVQEPLPEVPMGAPVGAWNVLGTNTLNSRRIMRNELLFTEINAFLNSFPAGRMRERIMSGSEISIAYVYTPDQEIRGLQLKLRTNNQPPCLVFSLGSLTQLHGNFTYYMHYRRGDRNIASNWR
uniref:Uncharacterized protein n=1 Tax=Chenopodium quinoa TaxID=63459 RepID=A0A803MN50_CHEQI